MEDNKLLEFDGGLGFGGAGDQMDYMSFSLPAASLRFAKRDILNYDMIPYERAKLVQQQRTVFAFTAKWDVFKGVQIGNLIQGTEIDNDKSLVKGKVLRINKNQDGSEIESYTILDAKTGTKKQLNPASSIKMVPMSRGTGRQFGGMTATSIM